MYSQTILRLFVIVVTLLFFASATASQTEHNLYGGVALGYGSTEWDMLATKDDPANPLTFTNPIKVNDLGYVWSAFLGYFVNPYFAMELSYARFGKTQLEFSGFANYWPSNNDPFPPPHEVTSRTQNLALVGKFLIPLSFVHNVQPYLSLGPAWTRRQDQIATNTKLVAQFGGGINYYFSHHWMAIFGYQFDTGSGKSDFQPAKYYIPFLIQVQMGIAYRLPLFS